MGSLVWQNGTHRGELIAMACHPTKKVNKADIRDDISLKISNVKLTVVNAPYLAWRSQLV
jgi:hypothetical protein